MDLKLERNVLSKHRFQFEDPRPPPPTRPPKEVVIKPSTDTRLIDKWASDYLQKCEQCVVAKAFDALLANKIE